MQINLIARSSSESYEAMEEGSEAHWEVVQRILFLYAKLNPGLGYVQGMNEIIGPIYFVMASDPLIENRSKCKYECVALQCVQHNYSKLNRLPL